MKYDIELAQVKNLLPNTQNILIALPSNSDIDRLSAGLALYLTFKSAGKNVTIVCDDTIRVAQAHLFGIDHVTNSIPSSSSGNLILTLEGVASQNGTIPALEKLDWYAENNNLNLVFHVLSGQTFQPVRITPKYQTGGFDLIFTIGASSLNNIGMVYQSNSQAFSNSHIVNIDNQGINANYGRTNIVDTVAASISEMVSNVIADLSYVMDADTATNLLTGIFEATKNLTDPKVSADTYTVVANCMRIGGKKPDSVSGQVQTPVFNAQFFQNQTGPQPDLSALMPQDNPNKITSSNDFIVPPVVNSNDYNQTPTNVERPVGEGVVSETIEPDWLTPKIFKGTSLG